MISDYSYENTRRITYEGGAIFIPVCSSCSNVKADKEIFVNDHSGLKDQSNATCKKCGRTKMIFEGFF